MYIQIPIELLGYKVIDLVDNNETWNSNLFNIGCQRNAEREFKLFYFHVSLDCGEQVMSFCEQGVELQGFHDEE